MPALSYRKPLAFPLIAAMLAAGGPLPSSGERQRGDRKYFSAARYERRIGRYKVRRKGVSR